MQVRFEIPKTELKQFINESITEAVRSALSKQQTENSSTTVMTPKEVCAFFNISLSTLHEWRKQGKLQAYYKGRRVYFKRTEVEASLVQAKQ
ncbi:helix-turn-helix domain-containing protein [Muricauda sp. 334s03]|uniref:Helix-turn-helix domain-containing protein n=1 Tax=Flagellimonas yonaguniensis TaxID=3031325 RepID=A0ABT5XX36_9FLAO|nr:helix-turn-helix domain-containing protein [[Muricauda] yonaguniensis]MDF0715751.1 helix-turn-helix domain-containing protein [[Muricauda] yonaguniensis]